MDHSCRINTTSFVFTSCTNVYKTSVCLKLHLKLEIMGAWVFLSFVEESSEQQDSDVITD